ncbi:hypothetical protein [Colwellia sp. MEBiC06753]
MLFLLLSELAVFFVFLTWHIHFNDIQIKLWSDEKLISSLPYYQALQLRIANLCRLIPLISVDTKINYIKAETASRFKYDRVRAVLMD